MRRHGSWQIVFCHIVPPSLTLILVAPLPPERPVVVRVHSGSFMPLDLYRAFGSALTPTARRLLVGDGLLALSATAEDSKKKCIFPGFEPRTSVHWDVGVTINRHVKDFFLHFGSRSQCLVIKFFCLVSSSDPPSQRRISASCAPGSIFTYHT